MMTTLLGRGPAAKRATLRGSARGLIFEVTEGSASSGGSHCGVSSAPWRAVLMLGLMLANGPRVWPSRPNGRAGLEKQKNPELDIVLLDIGLRFVDGRLRTPNRSGSP
jgi:hypothetical protein